jgi:hypothetical protein
MKFEEAYEVWNAGRLTQEDARGCWASASGIFVGTWSVMKRKGWTG